MIQHFLEERFHKAVRFFSSLTAKDLDVRGNVKIDGGLTVGGVDPARPYKVYTALLTQTGTNAPIATVLENTLGGNVVWTRTYTGQYKYVLSNAHFDKTKTVFIGLSPMARNFIVIFWDDLNDPLGEFFLETYDNFSNSADELLNDFCFEIRVYE